MNLISLENICKSYSEKILLNNISLGINEGEKIGVIGINGIGKSTLLKIVAGISTYDSGNIITANKLTISYLSQNTYFDDNATVIEQIFNGNSPFMKVLRDYESTLNEINKNPEDDILQQKLVAIISKIDSFNGWDLEGEAKIILGKLGINNFDAKVNSLSGGQKKRIALASALIKPSDLLILDEPTNHIDNETVAWLEEYLNKRKGALLMITHDRYFLDRVTNRILEINRGNIYSYAGNYSVFLEKKLERQELEKSSEEKRQNLLRRELAWIKRGAKARSTKQKARIQRFEELRDSGIEQVDDKIEISAASTRLGKKVLELHNINKKYKDKVVINDFSYIFSKNDRVGIIGPNGMGKSTLLNICTKKIAPDNGEVIIGETVKFGYFAQGNKEINKNLRVIEYIKEGAEFIKSENGELISASKMLEMFLFTPEMQWTPISKLSGGEKRRLYLLRILMEAPNVLILDEPTNDLDIETLTILEDYIQSFNGTIIAVSHDRYFLDKIADKLLVFKGKGLIDYHVGNYSEYMEKENQRLKDTPEPSVKKEKSKAPKEENKCKNKNNTLKFSYKEKREYEQIDDIIQNTEDEICKLDEEISKCTTDYVKLEELLQNKKEVEEKLEHLYERWEYLNELAQKIQDQKK
jgi:ATP-binding cassette subfamily F protein uup